MAICCLLEVRFVTKNMLCKCWRRTSRVIFSNQSAFVRLCKLIDTQFHGRVFLLSSKENVGSTMFHHSYTNFANVRLELNPKENYFN